MKGGRTDSDDAAGLAPELCHARGYGQARDGGWGIDNSHLGFLALQFPVCGRTLWREFEAQIGAIASGGKSAGGVATRSWQA